MFKVDLDTRELGQRLNNLTRRVSRLEVPLRKFGDYLKTETEIQFDREVDPSSARWAALAASTLREKRRLGYPSKILTRTGALKNSISYTASGKTLNFGLDSPYAIYHQKGTDKMPQRIIVGMNSARHQMLVKLIKSYMS